MSEVTEISVVPLSDQDRAELPLLADTQFFELMGSVSFNRKFTGIVPPGIYRGFNFSITGVDKVTVCTDVKNTAAVERDGQIITVQGQHPIVVTITRGVEVAVVIEAISQYGLLTSQVDKGSAVLAAQIRVVPLVEVEPHHVIIFTANFPLAGNLTLAHISVIRRTVGGLNNTPTFEQAAELYQPKGNYLTVVQAAAQYQPKGSYLTVVQAAAQYQPKGDYLGPDRLQMTATDPRDGIILVKGAFGLGSKNLPPLSNGFDQTDGMHSGLYKIYSPDGLGHQWSGVVFGSEENGQTSGSYIFIRHAPDGVKIIAASSVDGQFAEQVSLLHSNNLFGNISAGAMFQRGSNSNGQYELDADGQLFMAHRLTPPNNGSTMTWQFPINASGGEVIPLSAVFQSAVSGRVRNVTISEVTNNSLTLKFHEVSGVYAAGESVVVTVKGKLQV